MPTESEAYFQRLRTCLDLESEAERQRMAQRRATRAAAGSGMARNVESRGDTLTHLVIADHRVGLGGRAVIQFTKRNPQMPLPWHRFRVGTPVVASDETTLQDVGTGVVSGRSSSSLEVVFDEWPEGSLFRLEMSSDEITRTRQLAALASAESGKGRIARWRSLLIEPTEVHSNPVVPLDRSPDLNASQWDAIEFALAARELAILHGPPGTGKTTTVAELIRQTVLRGQPVLACAPSNTGVDNLLEKLVATGVRAVRLGHPARVHELLHEHTLDHLVECDPGMKIVRDMHRESEKLQTKAGKWTRGKPAPGAREDLRSEARRLREDARAYERQIIATILDRAEVLCATTNFDPELLGDRMFPLGVIDEACQSTEPGIWPVVLRVEKLVMAGDHCQLPPTVLAKSAETMGFGISMMERLTTSLGEAATRMLTKQYRMHRQIMEFSSKHFYQGKLTAAETVAEHRLHDIVPDLAYGFPEEPVSFVDTAGASWDEQLDADGESKLNPKEGEWVIQRVTEWIESGMPPSAIAVIAPYVAQVRWLRDHCPYRDVEIDTVDGFQGREKEAIVISLVRSNERGEIGFLADERRMNVAMTRAKRKLILIGDSATLARHPFYAELLEHLEATAAYHTIWEFAS
ncbi:MAG: AAA domain-containing protein [Pirellula sp.]